MNNAVENIQLQPIERVRIFQALAGIRVMCDKILVAQKRIEDKVDALAAGDNNNGSAESEGKYLARGKLFLLIKPLMKPGREYHFSGILHLLMDSGYSGPLPEAQSFCASCNLLAGDGLLTKVGKGRFLLPVTGE